MDKVSEGFSFGSVIFGNSPLLIYTISYLSGILIGSNYEFSPQSVFLFSTSCSILTYLIYYFCFKLKSSLLDFYVFLFSIISFISLGCFNICSSEYGTFSTEKSILLNNSEIFAECVILERPVIKEKRTSIQVLVPKYNEGTILYLDKKYPVSNLEIGDTIFTKLTPMRVMNYEGSRFDYAVYLEKRGIYSTSYVRSDQIVIKKLVIRSLNERIGKLRERYIDKIIALVGSENEAATMVAITIGEMSYLDKDIKAAYSNSGTMHLLAVSGMHVVFIYAFLTFFLSILGNYKYSLIIRFIIITFSLWFFAAIAGFVPSITRAVLMATVYEICKITERRRIGLNTLSLSALIITIVEPQAIFDVGFQLSYIALLSIIVIHPKINRYYLPKNIIVKYIWTTVSISIACQIGTSIITITTFGFFPTYFLLSNLLAIPLSEIILYLALGQLVFIGNASISEFIVYVLRFLIQLLNSIVTRIEDLPYPTIALSLNDGQIISIIMLVIISTINIIEDKIFKKYISLGFVISFIMCSL